MRFSANIFFLFALFAFFSCKTGEKVLETYQPFEVEEATFQNHFYGARQYGHETEITIKFKSINEGVQLDSIYFRRNAAKLNIDSRGKLYYTASFKVPSAENKVMHLDPAMEMNNPVPDLDSGFPFTLKNDEAVIRYRANNKYRYVKITDLKEIKPMAYPSGFNTGNNH